MKSTKLKTAVVLVVDIPTKLRAVADKTIAELKDKKYRVKAKNAYLYEPHYDLEKDAELLVAFDKKDLDCESIIEEYKKAGVSVQLHGSKLNISAPEQPKKKEE